MALVPAVGASSPNPPSPPNTEKILAVSPLQLHRPPPYSAFFQKSNGITAGKKEGVSALSNPSIPREPQAKAVTAAPPTVCGAPSAATGAENYRVGHLKASTIVSCDRVFCPERQKHEDAAGGLCETSGRASGSSFHSEHSKAKETE